MLSRFYSYGVLTLALTASGCARVEITRLADANSYSEGLRFYRPAPYVVTSLEKDNVCTSRIVYLPDPEQEYVLRVHSGWGSVDGKVTLENGWNLASLGETRDSKAPETITAVGGLVGGLIPKLVPERGEVPPPPPARACKVGLAKLVYDKAAHTWLIP
jgi:hypothetical protein